jgi:cysteine desulfurase
VACSAIEHKAILASVSAAAAEGADRLLLAVDGAGRITLEAVAEAIAAGPCVLSVMWGNNEIGTLQPVQEIAERCAEHGVTMHTDAVQAMGKVRVRVDETPCSLLTISSHKINGPQGVGALFVRDGVSLHPSLFGGGQERQLRPGTENVAGIVGFARAAELAAQEQAAETERLGALRTLLEQLVTAEIADAVVHGAGADRLPHICNFGLPGADPEALLLALDLEGVAASGGSACQSGGSSPSHVLLAIGAAGDDAASVRMSLGHDTTEDEIRRAARALASVVSRQRTLAAR